VQKFLNQFSYRGEPASNHIYKISSIVFYDESWRRTVGFVDASFDKGRKKETLFSLMGQPAKLGFAGTRE
jgi:hypothetical protein